MAQTSMYQFDCRNKRVVDQRIDATGESKEPNPHFSHSRGEASVIGLFAMQIGQDPTMIDFIRTRTPGRYRRYFFPNWQAIYTLLNESCVV